MKTFVLVCCLAALLLASRNVPFTALSKLQGNWSITTRNKILYESWTKIDQKEMYGKNYAVKEGDTIVFEKIRLVERKDGIFFISNVTGQNNGKSVSFKLSSSDRERFVFENKDHDFPNRIIYHFITGDSIVARIEATDGSGGVEYFYKRMK